MAVQCDSWAWISYSTIAKPLIQMLKPFFALSKLFVVESIKIFPKGRGTLQFTCLFRIFGSDSSSVEFGMVHTGRQIIRIAQGRFSVMVLQS